MEIVTKFAVLFATKSRPGTESSPTKGGCRVADVGHMISLICCKDSSNTVSVWGEQCTSENLAESHLRNIGEERQRSFNILLRAILVHVLAQKHGQKRLACSQT